MLSTNPLNYSDSRNLRNSSSNECTGMCEKCLRGEVCAFSHASRLRAFGYRDNDDKFNSRMLDAFQFRTRYGRNNNPGGEGSSEGGRSYRGAGRGYSGMDYRKELGITSGFHGSYGEGGAYPMKSNSGGKSGYCSSGNKGCGK